MCRDFTEIAAGVALTLLGAVAAGLIVFLCVVWTRPDPILMDGVLVFEHRQQGDFVCTSVGAYRNDFPVGPCKIITTP